MWWALSTGSDLTALLIVLLIVLWGAVFLPAILRARQETSPTASVGTFRRGMSALGSGGSAGRWIVMPPRPVDPEARRRQVMARRRQLFMALLVAAGTTLVLGILPELRWMLYAHLVVDLLLSVYVVFLLRVKQSGSSQDEVEEEDLTEEVEYLQVSDL